MRILGLHHVTAIAGDPQRNLEFYTRVLGLRLVKLTVNFDAPDTYHFYYGDRQGNPGTILTFFPWPNGRKGRRGTRQVTTVSWAVPENALPFWMDRLAGRSVKFTDPRPRFDEQVITFLDPDGLETELVAARAAGPAKPWTRDGVPEDKAVRQLHSVTVAQREPEGTPSVLAGVLGFRELGRDGDRIRFAVSDEGPGQLVDLVVQPDIEHGDIAVGTVHHVAFRTSSVGQQHDWREKLMKKGIHATPVVDRTYFRSTYFRDPGGVLFEIATDPPGFAVDEHADRLGSALKLPSWLESNRLRLERNLPTLHIG